MASSPRLGSACTSCGTRVASRRARCMTCRRLDHYARRARYSPLPGDLTPAEIDARFAAAKATLRRTRPFPLDPWHHTGRGTGPVTP